MMNKTRLFVVSLLLLIACATAFAVAATLDGSAAFVWRYGGDGRDEVSCVTVTESGDFLLLGMTNSTAGTGFIAERHTEGVKSRDGFLLTVGADGALLDASTFGTEIPGEHGIANPIAVNRLHGETLLAAYEHTYGDPDAYQQGDAAKHRGVMFSRIGESGVPERYYDAGNGRVFPSPNGFIVSVGASVYSLTEEGQSIKEERGYVTEVDARGETLWRYSFHPIMAEDDFRTPYVTNSEHVDTIVPIDGGYAMLLARRRSQSFPTRDPYTFTYENTDRYSIVILNETGEWLAEKAFPGMLGGLVSDGETFLAYGRREDGNAHVLRLNADLEQMWESVFASAQEIVRVVPLPDGGVACLLLSDDEGEAKHVYNLMLPDAKGGKDSFRFASEDKLHIADMLCLNGYIYIIGYEWVEQTHPLKVNCDVFIAGFPIPQ